MGFLQPGSSGSQPGALPGPTHSPPYSAPLFPAPLGAPRRCQSESRGKVQEVLPPPPAARPVPPPSPPLLCPSPAPSNCTALVRGPRSPVPLSRVAEPRSRVMSASPWREYGPHPSAATPVSLLGPFLSRLAKSEFSLQRMGRGLRTSPLSTPGEEKTPPPLFLTAALKLHRPCSSRPRQRLLIQGVGHRRKSIPDKNQLLPEGAAAIDTRARRGAAHPPPRGLFCQQ